MKLCRVLKWGRRAALRKTSIGIALAIECLSVAAHAQTMYDQFLLPPHEDPALEAVVPTVEGEPPLTMDGGPSFQTVDPTLPFGEAYIHVKAVARAVVVGDDTRLADFSGGKFVPSAIPVPGQPFFGTDSRARLQASGSAVRFDATVPTWSDVPMSAHAQLMLEEAEFPTTDSFDDTRVSIRQIYARLNRLTVGVMESAFADPSAVPEVIDLAGPNARVTIYDAGTGDGQGRLSYDLLSDSLAGFEIVASVEQSIPETRLPTTTDKSFSHYPDFICALQYVDGEGAGAGFRERWHVQWASIVRDVGFESPSSAEQSVFGWGTALSGAYRFRMNPNIQPLDRAMFSVVVGEGISHYITDLNAAADTGDAVVNAAGVLEPLPAFGWYAAYSHHWTDCLRSTATVSHVSLDSIVPFGGGASPYRTGDFFAINLIHRTDFGARQLYTGVEYLFGQKETLDGAEGDAHRLMFAVVITEQPRN